MRHAQEHKLLVPVADLGQADAEVAARMGAGLDWTTAAAGVHQELGRPVDCAGAWGAYMALRGSRDDEHCVVALKVRAAAALESCMPACMERPGSTQPRGMPRSAEGHVL